MDADKEKLPDGCTEAGEWLEKRRSDPARAERMATTRDKLGKLRERIANEIRPLFARGEAS
jgi:hypothetical protein